MKKNWTLFIIICVLTYGWMLWDTHNRNQALAAYNAEKAEKARIQQVEDDKKAARVAAERTEKAKQLEEAKALALAGKSPLPSTNPSDSTTSVTTPQSPEQIARDIIRLSGNPEEAPRHVIETPLYRVEFSELGAKAIHWEIKSSQFVTNVDAMNAEATTTTMTLIPAVGLPEAREYPFELAGSTVREFNNVMFRAEREDTADGTKLVFTSDPIRDGLVARKEFLFRSTSYVVDVKLNLTNGASLNDLGTDSGGFGIGWRGGFGPVEAEDRVHGLVQTLYSQDSKIRTRHLAAWGEKYEVNSGVQWAGQEKRFFVALMFPDATNPKDVMLRMRTATLGANQPQLEGPPPVSVELMYPPVRLAAAQQTDLGFQVYAGPKSREALSSKNFVLVKGRPKPSAAVFHYIPLGMSFLRPLCLLLLDLMRWFHTMLGVWGIAIICTTLVVRLTIYPLTHWSIKNTARTMVEQEKIRPELAAITKKYKNDSAKKTQAMMQLYQEHGINPVMGPLRGCVPALLQMPIFMSLYVLFEQAVELKGQSFLWIRDLSQPDRLFSWGFHVPVIGDGFNILPVLMGISNFFMMKIMQMPATDETQAAVQKQMMYIMPFMIVFFVYQMPAGLTLYYTLSNVFTVIQSLVTKRVMAKHRAEHEARLANRPVRVV